MNEFKELRLDFALNCSNKTNDRDSISFFQIGTVMNVILDTAEPSVIVGSMLIGGLLQDVVTITAACSDERNVYTYCN